MRVMPSATYPLSADPDTLSTREAAARLGLAVRSVQLMVDRGELVAWKTPGGHRRIAAESVERWQRERAAPRAAAPSPAVVDRAPAPPTPMTPRRRASDTRRPTVVLIEDSLHFQKVIRLLLERTCSDINLHVADDAIAGLALCGAVRPDVLVVDIMLPGIDGASLIGSLRTQPQFDGMGLLVVTGLDEEQRQPYADALEGITVIHKTELAQRLPMQLQALLQQSTST